MMQSIHGSAGGGSPRNLGDCSGSLLNPAQLQHLEGVDICDQYDWENIRSSAITKESFLEEFPDGTMYTV